jgi:transcriptional regulator with XRE-family HTH domain
MELAAHTVRTAREHARLSKRELARRAGTSPAAIVAYEAGTRDPTVGTLVRIVTAAGASVEFDVEPTRPRPDPKVAGERLAQVLELAEHLPRRPATRHLAYPPFARSS